MSLTPDPWSSMLAPVSERDVVIVGFPGVQVLDIAGPHEVFAGAGAAIGTPGVGYRVAVAAPGCHDIVTESGLTLRPNGELPTGQLDTIVVPGGSGVYETRDGGPIVGWLREVAPLARRVVSVSTKPHSGR